MAAWLDNCRFNPTAGALTDWTYSSAVAGYQSPASAGVVNGTKYKYFAIDTSNNWELGEGAYNTGTGVLARTTILFSSTGSKINFASAPQVAIVALKEDLLSVEEANSFTATQQAQARSNIGAVGFGDANKFRNGTMDVWQRGTAPSLTAGTTGSQYTADGWIVGWTASASAAPAIAQAAGLGLTVNSLKITGATNLTDVSVKQRIESYVAAPLASQTVTVQAKITNNTGGSITPTLTVKHPTAADNYGATTTDVNAVNLQACANGATTQVAYTFSAAAGSTNGLEVTFDFGNNFSANTKNVQISELDIRSTPGVATGLNGSPPAPELRPIFVEKDFCNRYLRTNYPEWTAPGSSMTGNPGGIVGGAGGYCRNISGSDFQNGGGVGWDKAMRAAPTLSFWDRAGASGKASEYQAAAWVDGLTDASIVATNATGFVIYKTSSSSALIFYLATAEL